jgi:membrane-bound serine protease (ClpP class)
LIIIITLILALLFLPWPWSLVAIASAACGEALLAVIGIRYTRRRRHLVGVETLVGRQAEVVSALAPTGQVKLGGEIWQARSEEAAQLGETVRIKAIDELTLEVERIP